MQGDRGIEACKLPLPPPPLPLPPPACSCRCGLCGLQDIAVLRAAAPNHLPPQPTPQAWRQVAQGSPALWRRISFSTHRNGSRRSELRRLRSLAAWAQRYAAHTQHLAISARVPAECQQQALKAVAQAALACASLESLSITANRGFWPAWLPSLGQLRQLHLCSKEGGLSLHGDLTPLQLTELVLEARHAVALADSVRCGGSARWRFSWPVLTAEHARHMASCACFPHSQAAPKRGQC